MVKKPLRAIATMFMCTISSSNSLKLQTWKFAVLIYFCININKIIAHFIAHRKSLSKVLIIFTSPTSAIVSLFSSDQNIFLLPHKLNPDQKLRQHKSGITWKFSVVVFLTRKLWIIQSYVIDIFIHRANEKLTRFSVGSTKCTRDKVWFTTVALILIHRLLHRLYKVFRLTVTFSSYQ